VSKNGPQVSGVMMANKAEKRGRGGSPKTIVLSDLDKAILAQLTADPFATNVAVGNALDVPSSLVASRLRILERNSVSQILAVIDLDRLGQSFCFIRIQVRGRKVEDVAAEIAGERLVLQVAELADGTADLLVLARFTDIHSLNHVLNQTLASISGVRRWQVDVVIDVPIFRSEYVTFTPEYRPLTIAKNIAFLREDLPADMCDEGDLQIIAQLQQNAHQSINDVARNLDMSPSTARYRINNLKNSEILRFIRVSNQAVGGISTYALLELNIDISRADAVIEALRGKEWLPQLFRCTGGADLMGIMLASSEQKILEIKREELSAIDGIDEIRLSYLHKTHKIDLRFAQRNA
jgi:DNA-binding Lrp family transcriptional regulator